jgi:signal transduction histidine kinase
MSRAPLRGLVIAVLVLFAGTAALVLMLSRAAASLSSKDEVIAQRAAPAIIELQTLRANVQQQRQLADEWVLGAPGDPGVRAAKMDLLHREAAQDRQAYLALAEAPGEAPTRKALVTALDRFDSLVARVRSQPPGHSANPSGDLYELDAAIGDVGRSLANAADFSADAAKKAAEQAIGVSRRLLPSAILLGVLSAAAAVVTIALTYRSVRHAQDLEERSRRALENKAEELEAFAGRVAHDLLSPLTTVGLGLDLAQRRAGESQDAPSSAAIARASATLQRVRGFVSDLLEFARAGARPPPGVHTQVDAVVSEVAQELEPIAHDASVELRVEPLPGRDVRCSPGVLTSLVSNLVQNAIKYVASSDVRRVVIRAFDLGEEVRVEVEDTGPGIPRSDQERLFDPFVRGRGAKAPGIGLGLATVRRLAEAHGGHAGVRSEPGHGSVFWFSVPGVV